MAIDPRTALDVMGYVSFVAGDMVRIEPGSPAYPLGSFMVSSENVRPMNDLTDEEMELMRMRWDVICLVMMGGLDKLDKPALNLLHTTINEGHL